MIIIKTTCSSEFEAKKITNLLLQEKLAACIQIKKIKSFYRWENKIQNDEEFELSIKTKDSLYNKIEEFIIKNHSYQIPQIYSIKINDCFDKYKGWIEKIQ